MFMAPEVLRPVKDFRVLPYVTDIYSFALTACFMILKTIPDMVDIHTKSIEFPDVYSTDL